MTQTDQNETLTADDFVASLPAQGHHFCMGLGIKAPKGQLGIGKDDGSAVDAEILAQFQSLPRAQVWTSALAKFGYRACLQLNGGQLGLATALGAEADAETLAYWLRNLPPDFEAELIEELNINRKDAS